LKPGAPVLPVSIVLIEVKSSSKAKRVKPLLAAAPGTAGAGGVIGGATGGVDGLLGAG